jgi:hypothetical protein
MKLLKQTCMLPNCDHLSQKKLWNQTTTNQYKTNTKNNQSSIPIHKVGTIVWHRCDRRTKKNQKTPKPGEDTESTATCTTEAHKPWKLYAILKIRNSYSTHHPPSIQIAYKAKIDVHLNTSKNRQKNQKWKQKLVHRPRNSEGLNTPSELNTAKPTPPFHPKPRCTQNHQK